MLFRVGMPWLFEDHGGPCGRGTGAEERGEEWEDEEEEKWEEVGECGAEGGLLFAAGGLCCAGSSSWCAAAELVDANAWAAAEIEDEAGTCVEAAYCAVSIHIQP